VFAGLIGIGRAQYHRNASANAGAGEGTGPIANAAIRTAVDGEDFVAFVNACLSGFVRDRVNAVRCLLNGEEGDAASLVAKDVVQVGAS